MTSSLRPPSTLLLGPAGTGKTTAVVTLIEAGVHVFMLATEPSAPSRVTEEILRRKLSIDLFDWCLISPAISSWAGLRESAEKVNTMSLKDLADLRGGIAKSDGKQWIALLDACNNFVSARTGKAWGDIGKLSADCAFVLDGLTGVNEMSRALTVGLKPTPSPGEWGIMQGNILTLVTKLCSDLSCFFVCIAHVEREQNELTGLSSITVSTLGAKLAPKLPPKFTSVVLAKREGAKFSWSTAAPGVDTKPGDLQFGDDLPPSFSSLVESFRKRSGLSAPAATQPSVSPAA